jgi:hypothetical protein
VATAVAAPAVTNFEGPAAPQAPAAQGSGNAVLAALALAHPEEAPRAKAATRIFFGSRCLDTRIVDLIVSLLLQVEQ